MEDNTLRRIWKLPSISCAMMAFLCPVMAQDKGVDTNTYSLTGQQVWDEYRSSPDRHPNISNCSFAGYRAGECPLPEPPVVANVRDFGAIANDDLDDTVAFNAAIASAALH